MIFFVGHSYTPDLCLAVAKKVNMEHSQELDICTMLHLADRPKEGGFPTGEHVLTFVPTVQEKIILAWLVTA